MTFALSFKLLNILFIDNPNIHQMFLGWMHTLFIEYDINFLILLMSDFNLCLWLILQKIYIIVKTKRVLVQ